MPNLEKIASEGRAYSDHYTQASHSNYADLCPLSSHYPLRSTGVHLYPENPTYPRVLIYDVLKSLGWHTAVISSQNEVWGQMINYLKTGNVDHFFHSETYTGPTYVPRDDDGFADFLKGSRRSGKIDDRFTVAEAIRWIDTVDDGAPFFIYLNLQNSHIPYETPADFPRRFGPAKIDFAIRFGGYPREENLTVKDLYSDSLAYSDHQLGKLVAHLKATGEWDRTLMVVTGDTGQEFYEHGRVAHAGQIWNEVMRVPLVIRAPGLTPALDGRPAQHIDIPPTVLELLGLPPHPSFQGRSLNGPWDGAERSRFLMAQTPLAFQFGIVRGNFKLTYDVKTTLNTMYNLARDPMEYNDIGPKNRKRVEKYRKLLDTWRKHQLDYYRDPALHARTYPPVLQD
jgi:arylsulfatase A-like enzyme